MRRKTLMSNRSVNLGGHIDTEARERLTAIENGIKGFRLYVEDEFKGIREELREGISSVRKEMRVLFAVNFLMILGLGIIVILIGH